MLIAQAKRFASTGEDILLSPSGELIDGRNRLMACFVTEVSPSFAVTEEDPWQIANRNLARRHLTTGQRASFAVVLAERIEKELNRHDRFPARCFYSKLCLVAFYRVEPIDTHNREALERDQSSAAVPVMSVSRLREENGTREENETVAISHKRPRP